MFSVTGFALMRAMGQQRGVTDTDALNRISLIGGAAGLTPIGIVVGDSLIRRELDSTTTVSTTLVATTPATPTPTGLTAQVPPVIGVLREKAEELLKQKKFTNVTIVVDQTSPADENTVVKQDPAVGEVVPIETTVTLTLSTGEGQAQTDKDAQETTKLIADKVTAVSEEVKKVASDVTPHVVGAIMAIKKEVDKVRTEATGGPAAVAAKAKQKPDGAQQQQPEKTV
jgi:beta-lactam-binding protein with PASTA domain